MMPQEELGETQILAALLGIAEMVGGLTDTEEILSAIVRIAPSLVRVDRCALMTYDETSREFRTAVAFGPAGRPTRYEDLVLPEADMPRLAQRLVKLRLPVLVKDATKEQVLPPGMIQRLGLRSVLIAPLVCRGHLLGALWLDSTTGQHYFTSKEINVILGIATEAAIAVDNGRLVEATRVSDTRFRALVSAVCDGVVTVDAELRIRDLDLGAERLLGWFSDEIRGRSMPEVFEISEGEASVSWRRDAEGPTTATKELELRTHDGSRVPCDVRTAVVKNADGQIVEILYALRRRTGASGAADRGTGTHGSARDHLPDSRPE